MEHKKRQVPPLLTRILEADKTITGHICFAAEKALPLHRWKPTFHLLEFSCHGAPTIAAAVAGIYLFRDTSIDCFLVNVFAALLLDLVCVAVVKAVARRRRPAPNRDDRLTVQAVDQYSFPSGHACRAVLLSGLLLSRAAWPPLLAPPLLAWAACVCASRMLLRRHYLLDVLAGMALGYLEYAVVLWLWLDGESCRGWVRWLGGVLGDDGADPEL
ncbi:phospholipid phosphatase 6-like [Pollicipes pollicipes]|uniref:phospholipid phosphatase 6-like n=1 Tax=Pollicipes pollicipes TaxID=41117 RepID=UPI001885361C|nr:phospholipid phosphatase 6-like [Pollicipes pollicipes]